LVTVAIDYRATCQKVESCGLGPEIMASAAVVSAILWHAPEVAPPPKQPEPSLEASSKPTSVEVHGCASCGFPVSPGRWLCVECERKPELDLASRAPLFDAANKESWLSAHGYTIASLLISLLAIAIILWFKR
jgi:hypothetical protein